MLFVIKTVHINLTDGLQERNVPVAVASFGRYDAPRKRRYL
jgi:hypothetical protein